MIDKTNKKYGELYDKGIMRNYHVCKHDYQVKSKKLSDHKRKLVSSGLECKFESLDRQTIGIIYLNDRGAIVIGFEKINGKEKDIKNTFYLIDVSDDILDSCERV